VCVFVRTSIYIHTLMCACLCIYIYIYSHIYVRVYVFIQLSQRDMPHISRLNKPCHTCHEPCHVRDIAVCMNPLMWMDHTTDMWTNHVTNTWMSHVTSTWMSHVTDRELIMSLTYGWVMSQLTPPSSSLFWEWDPRLHYHDLRFPFFCVFIHTYKYMYIHIFVYAYIHINEYKWIDSSLPLAWSQISINISIHSYIYLCIYTYKCICNIGILACTRGGGLGSRPIFKKFHETYAPS